MNLSIVTGFKGFYFKLNSGEFREIRKLLKKDLTSTLTYLVSFSGLLSKEQPQKRKVEWDEFELSKRAFHVSDTQQTKWWFAERFLNGNIAASYKNFLYRMEIFASSI